MVIPVRAWTGSYYNKVLGRLFQPDATAMVRLPRGRIVDAGQHAVQGADQEAVIMNPDGAFRLILVVCFLTIVSIALHYRLKSWASGEKLDRAQEGLFILATLRPVGLVLWLGVIAYMVNPAWMAWSSVPLPAWLRWTGVAVCVLAGALLTWTLRSLGTNLTDTVVTRRAHTLVTRGPYRWVRHPFYDSVALLILGISLIAANWFILLSGCAVVALLVVRTRTEEEKLLARFGEDYRAYIQQTGRFLPRILAKAT